MGRFVEHIKRHWIAWFLAGAFFLAIITSGCGLNPNLIIGKDFMHIPPGTNIGNVKTEVNGMYISERLIDQVILVPKGEQPPNLGPHKKRELDVKEII